MGVDDGDVVEEEPAEVEPAGAAELDGGRLCPDPAVGDYKVEDGAGGGLGAYRVVPCVDVAVPDDRAVGILDVDSVVVGRVEVAVDGDVADQRVLAPHQMETATIGAKIGDDRFG